MAVVVDNSSVNLRLILNDGVDVTIGARIKVVNSKSLLSKALESLPSLDTSIHDISNAQVIFLVTAHRCFSWPFEQNTSISSGQIIHERRKCSSGA